MMATNEELQQQIAALTARVDAITAPPTDYYTSRYSGEEADNAVARALPGGEIDAVLSNKAFLKHLPNSINYDNEYNFNGVTPYSDKQVGTPPPGSPEWMNLLTLNPGAFFASQLGFVLNASGTARGLYFRSRWTDNPDSVWHPWTPIATATPPQEYDLPLVAGVSATIAEPTYFKTQDGVVVVTLDINANEQIAKGTTKVVANLPAGYRPTRKINVCVLTHYAGVDGVALVTVSPNGAVSCASAANSWQHFYGQVSFVAA